MVTGRSSEQRTASITTTSGQAAVTGAAGTFSTRDVGRTISGIGIPAGTTITAVASATAATLSAPATATGTTTATIGPADGAALGFVGWSPESDAEAQSYSVAAANAGTVPPDRITDPRTPIDQRGRG